MKSAMKNLRDTVVAGLLFLLPVIVLFVLVTKVFQYFTGFTSRIAAAFGLKSIAGVSANTIIGAIGIVVICLICGYLVRIAFFKSFSNWLDEKMMAHIPGYAVYREMAVSKIDDQEPALPYESALWLITDEVKQPGFLIEKDSASSKMIVFIPTGGNVKEGAVFVVPESSVELCSEAEMKSFKLAIANKGLGLSEFVK